MFDVVGGEIDVFSDLKDLEDDLDKLSQQFFYLIKILKDNEAYIKAKGNNLALEILGEYPNIISVEVVNETFLHEINDYFKSYFKLVETNEDMLAGVGVTEEKLTNFLVVAGELESSFQIKALENKIKNFVREYENANWINLPFLNSYSFRDDFDNFVDEFKEFREKLELEVHSELKLYRATSGYRNPLPNDLVDWLAKELDDDIKEVALHMGLKFEIPDRTKISPFERLNGFLKSTMTELSELFPEKSQDELKVLAVRENQGKTKFLPKTFPIIVDEGFSKELPNKLKQALFENKRLMMSWGSGSGFNLESSEFILEEKGKELRLSDEMGRQVYFSSISEVLDFIKNIYKRTPEDMTALYVFGEYLVVKEKSKILRSLFGVDLGYNDKASLQESISLIEKKYEESKNYELLKPILALDVFARFQRFFHLGNGAASFKDSVQRNLDEYLDINQVSEFELSLLELRDLFKLVEQSSYEDLSSPKLEAQAEKQIIALERCVGNKYFERFVKPMSDDNDEDLDVLSYINWEQVYKEFSQFLKSSMGILDSAFKPQPEVLFSFGAPGPKLLDEFKNENENDNESSEVSNSFVAKFGV